MQAEEEFFVDSVEQDRTCHTSWLVPMCINGIITKSWIQVLMSIS